MAVPPYTANMTWALWPLSDCHHFRFRLHSNKILQACQPFCCLVESGRRDVDEVCLSEVKPAPVWFIVDMLRGPDFDVRVTLLWLKCDVICRNPFLRIRTIHYQFLGTCTRQAVYVKRNTEARSPTHCCRGRVVSIRYIFLCVCMRGACAFAHVALLIQHATLMHHIVLSLLVSVSTIFFDIIS
jgi:hypothetical protein